MEGFVGEEGLGLDRTGCWMGLGRKERWCGLKRLIRVCRVGVGVGIGVGVGGKGIVGKRRIFVVFLIIVYLGICDYNLIILSTYLYI